MKKPNVFVNKINKDLKNNETAFTSFNDIGERSIASLDSTSVRKKIKEIPDSPTYVYKADVIITTDKELLISKLLELIMIVY